MYTYLATAILAAALAFAGAWQTQNWRYGAMEKDRVTTQLETDRLAHIGDIHREERVITAQNAALGRAAVARRDAADSRNELDSVRALADSAVTAAHASHEACIVEAAALNNVFKSCAGRYQELGAAADDHANDVKTLSDAWPKD